MRFFVQPPVGADPGKTKTEYDLKTVVLLANRKDEDGKIPEQYSKNVKLQELLAGTHQKML